MTLRDYAYIVRWDDRSVREGHGSMVVLTRVKEYALKAHAI